MIRVSQLAQLHPNAIVVNHGLSKILITCRDIHFISLFWKTLVDFKTKLAKFTIYYTQTDDQTEISNKIIKCMLWTFTLNKQQDWCIFFASCAIWR